ncbi:hypothetical protein EDD86DRAFT_213477 [Gorgonomyces haynaldii]|nr:hypothetical protein EDD86DRAFT_213477 [Gorgonomyces haynaldii]
MDKKLPPQPPQTVPFVSMNSLQSLFQFPEGIPSVQIYKSHDYVSMPWKNGLGDTVEFAIRPAGRNPTRDPFVWRLSSSEIRDSCTQALMPGYDISVVLLPNEHESTIDFIHHDGAEHTTVYPMEPYTYSGDWPTNCRIPKTNPVKHLNFMVNRKLAQYSMSIERFYPMADADETADEFTVKRHLAPRDVTIEPASPTNKFTIGRFTVLFIISGSVKVSIEGDQHPHILDAGQTLVSERDDNIAPTDLSITPISHGSDNGDPAVVLTIQVQVFKTERSQTESVSSSPRLVPQPGIPTRRRTLSIINLHDDAHMDPEGTYPSTHHGTSAHQYKPPVFAARYKNESEVPPPVVRDSLVIEDYPMGTISTAWINMVKQGLSEWMRVPVIIARGVEPGPVVGITAVVHGNELNGVPCIHRVITDINVHTLKGTLVAVPCVNVPGYLRFSREFSDGKDLNRSFPGQPTGTASQVYNYNFFEKIITKLNFLIDLHTASFGRVNSYYVRSDLNDPVTAAMAKLQQPQVILHNSGQDGTLRSEAAIRGIKAITVEIGNPQLLQNQYVQWSYMGVMRILNYLGMFQNEFADTSPMGPNTLVCSKGFWIYTTTGGVLEVYPQVNSIVRKGDLIARIKNIFGNIIQEIFSPNSGIVIGRSSNPVAMTGDRVVHLGILKKENEILPKIAKENY